MCNDDDAAHAVAVWPVCLQVPPELAAVQLKRKTPSRPTLQQLQSNLQAMGLSEQQQQQSHLQPH
jgi:hypothetical protein